MKIFDMVVHRMSASPEAFSDHSDRMAKDEMVKNLLLAIGEPGFVIGDSVEREVGFGFDQREEGGEGVDDVGS